MLTTTTDSWGLCDYSIGDAHFQINVNQWTRVHPEGQEATSTTYKFYRNDTHGRLVLNGWANSSTNITTTWQWNISAQQYSTYFGGGITYAENMRPETNKTGVNSFGTAYVRINSTGSISIRAIDSTIQKGTEFYCMFEWAICEDDLDKAPILGNTAP